MNPRVTVAIPILNAERTLGDAIRSVFAQTFRNWVLLLVDDGSTDRSLEIVRRIRDPRVAVLADGLNKGLPTRLNEIAALTETEYLARMDADDLMHPERLERQLRFLEQHPAIDLLGTANYTIDQANNPVGVRNDTLVDDSKPTVLREGYVVHPTITGRTSWFRGNLYDPGFLRAQDYELWCRVCPSRAITTLPEPLLFYRETVPIKLRNYLLGSKTTRRVLRKYGPPIVGRLGTAVLVGKSHLKGWLYIVCTLLGMQGRLLRKRNRSVTPTEAEEARALLTRILGTEIPGLSNGAAAPQGSAACAGSTARIAGA
jgi:glycosyltransferase involved in cell wall biosynthesis